MDGKDLVVIGSLSLLCVSVELAFLGFPQAIVSILIGAIGTAAGILWKRFEKPQPSQPEPKLADLSSILRINEEREWKKEYHEHSILIGKAIFDGWKNNSGILASWNYERGQLAVSDPKDPDIPYFEQAKSHLQEGYHDFWSSFQQSQANSVEMSKGARLWVESFEKLAVDQVRSSCPEVEVSREGFVAPVPESCCYIRSVFDTVFFQAPFKATGKVYGGFNIGDLTTDIRDVNGLVQRKTVKYLSFSGVSLGHGNTADMQKLQEAMEILISDGLVQYYIKEFHALQTKLADQVGRLDKEVRNIQSRVQAGEPLKGSCDLCPSKPSLSLNKHG